MKYLVVTGLVLLGMIDWKCLTDNKTDSATVTDKTEATTVTDIDGNIYQTVLIGDQLWFAENLRTTRYNDGTFIPNVPDELAWSELNSGARSYYDNDSTQYDTVYGPLYNWYAVKTGKLCPTGWDVPSPTELFILTEYLGGEGLAGDKLKEIGEVHWKHNIGATDEMGFTALPGGRRYDSGSFANIKLFGYWWSRNPYNSNDSSFYMLSFISANFIKANHYSKRNGFSVRCFR